MPSRFIAILKLPNLSNASKWFMWHPMLTQILLGHFPAPEQQRKEPNLQRFANEGRSYLKTTYVGRRLGGGGGNGGDCAGAGREGGVLRERMQVLGMGAVDCLSNHIDL